MALLSDLLYNNQNTLLPLLFLTIVIYYLSKTRQTDKSQAPPYVPYSIPFIGSAIAFGTQPVHFLADCKKKYGDCFTFKMIGRNMTFCLGAEGNNFIYNIPLSTASAEGAYLKLTRPVFGSEVVYDCPNSVLMEQKKFVKEALSTNAFKSYVPIIVAETKAFMNEFWADAGEFDLFEGMSELTIRTASACLMGAEIRSKLHSNVAKLYYYLDRGFTPLNVFIEYLPLPRFIQRDAAHKELTALFMSIIQSRKNTSTEEKYDVLNTLINSEYKSGEKMSDTAVAHMMIALLLAGQHTSSTTSTWCLFRLAENPGLISDILRQESLILTGTPDTPPHLLPPHTFESLKQCTVLDSCLKETLRLHPPIHTVMRLVEKDTEFKGLKIPKGDFLCSGITVGHLDEDKFPNPLEFDPSRHVDATEGGEWTFGGVDIAQKSAKNLYLPFGAGRHRCIGEHFAYVQNKLIVSTVIREFELALSDKGFPMSDFTQLIVLPVKKSMIKVKRRERI